MDSSKAQITIYCPDERKVVGVIEVAAGAPRSRVTISASLAWNNYYPEEERYKLKAQPRDGDFLICPHCLAKLSLVGRVKIDKPRVENGKVERDTIPRDTVPIVLGATAIEFD